MGKSKSTFKFGQIFDPSFGDLSPSEITQNLQTAYKIVDGVYTKSLTAEEVSIAKSELAEISIELSKIEEERKLAMEDFKAEAKMPKAKFAELLETIKFKTVRKSGLLYEFQDFESGEMASFDSDAICVDVRPLSPKERQHSISESEGVRQLIRNTN
jgi:hypothetical protein